MQNIYKINIFVHPDAAGIKNNGIKIMPLARIININLLGMIISSLDHVDNGNILVKRSVCVFSIWHPI